MNIQFKFGFWIHFPYKHAFPNTDVLSNWIATLAIITNDLTLVNKLLVKEFDRTSSKGSPEVSYYLWLSCAHYREAIKYINNSRSQTKISSFIKSLPESVNSEFEEMINSYEPWENSFLKNIIKPIRDTFIHYPAIDSSDWTYIWKKLEKQNGELHQRGSAIGDSRWVFADDIRINLIKKNIEDSGQSIENVVQLLAVEIVRTITISQTIIIEYFDRLPDGIIIRGKKTTVNAT